MSSKIRWVYLTTAPNQLTAEMWRELLRGKDIPAIIRSGDTASFLGLTNAPCRLMIPEERLQEARLLLVNHLGPESLV